MKRNLKALMGCLAVALLSVATPLVVFASPNTQLQQVIGAGTLSTDVLDASQVTVASPSVAMSALNVSSSCQTTTGTYGTNSQRIYVDNPSASATGWVLSVAATSGSSALWTSGGNTYDFNNPAASGCTGGQLTVNPSVGAINAQSPSTTTGVSLGSSAAFNQGTVDTIELVNAGASSDDIWRGYFTGISLSQAVPGSQVTGTYALSLTQTVVAQ